MLRAASARPRHGGYMSAPTLTGPETPLVGRVEPANDEVIAVFRNGKLIDIWDSGDRARALWLKYRPGSLTYARLLRSDIRIDTTVPSVLVADEWLLPQVQVKTFVALSKANRYSAL